MKNSGFIFILLPCFALCQTYFNPAGVRSAALAHSSVALHDIWSAHHNQAGLAFLEKSAAAFSYEKRYFLDDLNLAHAAMAFPLKFGCIGASLSHFGFHSFHHSRLGLSYSKLFSKVFSVGLQLNYHRQFVAEGSNNSGALSFETGFILRPLRGLQLGFHVFNPSRNYLNHSTNHRLPVILRFGGRYHAGEHFMISGEISKTDSNTDARYAVGLEYRLKEQVVLRTGIGSLPVEHSLGIGLAFGRFTTDLSFSNARYLGNTAGLGMQYEF